MAVQLAQLLFFTGPVTLWYSGTFYHRMARQGRIPREFRYAVEEYRARVFTFAFYYLRNREEAEDVTQEVFIRLWQRWQDISGDHLRPWLIHVTRNICIDTLRKRRTRHSHFDSEAQADTLNNAADRAISPADIVERNDLRAHCEQAIAALPEPFKSILILREIQDMQYSDISEALDLPMNTVKVYLYRGRRMLRKHLGEVLNEI